MIGLGGVGLDVLYGVYFSYGSRAGINGVAMGFYDLPLEVEFPCGPNPP
jgi:hypothetical protein